MEFKFEDAFKTLPRRLMEELIRRAGVRVGGVGSVSEVRLLLGRGSSFVLHGVRVRLSTVVSGEDIAESFRALCSNAIYAHRDTITDGYVSCEGGVRVGVCGQARYEGDRIVGVSGISALVYRFPTAKSSLEGELFSAYKECRRGMLIYSKAGVGKTTALRTLASRIAMEQTTAVAVVDERCEFSVSECAERGVILLRGYKRSLGMDIALRTLGAEVIMVDEIGSPKEAESMRVSLLSGVRFIATAHAASYEELIRRDGIAPLINEEIFDVFFGIFHTDTGYCCEVKKLNA